LQQAIEQLPAEAREVLRLRYVENLPSKQIAERIGKSDAAVRTLLTRCLRRLEETLGSDADPGKRS
jgi:RNA polymerase sigma-70 factor (ECF subfamily)